MAKIKVNADIYSGNDKIPTTTEVTNMIDQKFNELNDKIDTITEITKSELDTIFENAYNKVFGNQTI